mmetsp:Transcript_70394/g.155702  ORF Transcript_70394/g.155702 Transcript_70394/m.155702 type:complete len:106 (+) Transcript_70394:515-832(+)
MRRQRKKRVTRRMPSRRPRRPRQNEAQNSTSCEDASRRITRSSTSEGHIAYHWRICDLGACTCAHCQASSCGGATLVQLGIPLSIGIEGGAFSHLFDAPVRNNKF